MRFGGGIRGGGGLPGLLAKAQGGKGAKGQQGGAGFWLVVGLVALVGVAASGSMFFGTTGDHRPQYSESHLWTIKGRLDAFKLEFGRYPTQAEGLEALVTPPTKANGSVPGPFIDGGALQDAWGHPIRYVQPAPDGAHDFDLVSLGADGEPGGDHEDADISLNARRTP